MILPLDDAVIEEKREKLKDLLIHLADDYDDNLDDTIEILNKMYCDGYRQMYSEIFPIIVDISKNKKGGLDLLTENMESVRLRIKQLVQDDEKIDTYKNLYGKVLKLSDHINLEVQRLHDYEKIREELDRSVTELSDKVDVSKNDLRKMRCKIRKMQTEVIIILGIFPQ